MAENNETVLVTGAGGYIGRHVVDALLQRGCQVSVAVLPGAHIAREDVTVIRQPIFDGTRKNLYEALGAPDRCVHLAWKDGFSHNAPTHLRALPDHVRFLQQLIEGGIKSISVAGSMHEIGYWEGMVSEDTPANPLSLYGVAKNALRQAALIMAKNSDTSLKWLRGYYLTGDDEHNHSVFSKVAESARQGKTTFPFTSGLNEYDFINIDEFANQVAAATLQDEVDGVIECCSGIPVALGEQVERFIREHGYSIQLERGAYPDRAYDSPCIYGNNEKIQRIMRNEAASQ